MTKTGRRVASRRKTPNAERDRLCRAVLAAAEAAGGQFGDEGLVSYLQAQAVATPSPFLTLLSKVIQDEDEKASAPVIRVEIVAPQLDNMGRAKAEGK